MIEKVKKTAVNFFCTDLAKDPVAPHVLKVCAETYPLRETNLRVDDRPVQELVDDAGNRHLFVAVREVISHNYDRYLPIMNDAFADADVAHLVNWHEGNNAPNNVLSYHTTGDLPAGMFGPADPVYMRNLHLALEAGRIKLGLDDFRVLCEGTHWSGVNYGGQPEVIMKYAVPLADVEIGSYPGEWGNPTAHRVLANALLQVFARKDEPKQSCLCVGGRHFEEGFCGLVAQSNGAVAISHILPNQWLSAGGFDTEAGLLRLKECIGTIRRGVTDVVYHDKLPGSFKQILRRLTSELELGLFSHKQLRKRIGEEVPGGVS